MAVSVAVLGYASADRAVVVSELPASNATAIVERASRPAPRLGGCGPQIAARLAADSVPAACLTWVADDAMGGSLLDQLRRSGADTTGVVVAGRRTAEAFIACDRAGNSLCFYDPGDAHGDGLSPAQERLLAEAGCACLTVAPAGATRAALAAVREDALVVWSVKADPVAYPPDLVARLLERADVVALSAGERPFLERQAAGHTPRTDAIEVETHGADGVAWRRGGAWRHVAVERLRVLDATGAGDALVAGVVGRLVRDGEDVGAAVAAGIASSRALLEERAREEDMT